MTHGEFALLDEARALIDPELRRFGHVVVDEAQNLTPMELRMVVRRARRQSLTVLGDVAQRTAEAGLSTWDAVLREAGVDRIDIEELLVSYRVPDDFLRIASGLAPGAAVPRGVRRAPWAAVAVRTQRRVEVAHELAARMQADVGSVGVIVPEALHAEVAADLGSAATEAEESLSGGVNLLGLEAIKGLEFDAAVVLEPRLILGERPGGGVGGLYTALTRSTRALAVVHAEPLPDVLADADDLRPVPEAGAAEAWAAGRR
jgi:DNA helicase IV